MMDDRRTKIQADVARITSLADECIYLRVKEFSEDSLQLELHNPLENQNDLEVSFNFSITDYPEGTVVSLLSMGDIPHRKTSIHSEARSLLDLVAIECYEWCKTNELQVPSFVDQVLEKDRHALTSQVSACSSAYVETEGSDVEESDTYDDTDDAMVFDGMDKEESVLNSVLELEIGCVQHIFGENSIESRVHAGINEMDLFFKLDLNNFLDSFTASGWGVNLEKPLIILLRIQSKYLDGAEPQVEVFQESSQTKGEKIRAGVGVQMRKIMESFVTSQWKKLSNAEMATIMATSEKQNSTFFQPLAPCFSQQISLGAQISMDYDSDADSQTCKMVPSMEDGFLIMFLKYALNRICSLNEFCVICDEKHVLECGLIKPCVCTRELCIFSFQTLGVMADTAEAIPIDAHVVDLLIAMVNAAAHSPRCEIILDPFPCVVDPDNSARLALDPAKKDFKLVVKVLADVVEYQQRVMRGRTKSHLNDCHKLAVPLMQWIIATCRARVIFLPQDKSLKTMRTPYQFLLIGSPPKKEAAFKTAKAKFGSTFAFHGSNIENWHSILRKGLLNASGTKYQVHGAIYGSGVYLSPSSDISFGYAMSFFNDKFVSSELKHLAGNLKLRCLALCEVILSNDLKRKSDIWVCPNTDYVCTRFFFVYDHSITVSIKTDHPTFKKEIDYAMAYIQTLKQPAL